MKLFLLLAIVGASLGDIVDQLHDTYEEELIIKRLASRQILSQFRFSIESNGSAAAGHYELFPRIIDEIVQKYKIRDLQLSLTQGFWRTSQWGYQPKPETPNGAQLIVLFEGGASKKVIDQRWTYLVNSLNGIFCTSLMELVPTLTSSPRQFRSDLIHDYNAEYKDMRYGALGGETVCTENLTPWKKLLPCKHNGIGHLLNPTRLYESAFHSLTLRVKRTGDRRQLDMTASYLADLPLATKEMGWSFRKLYDRIINSQCAVATKSAVLVGSEEIPDIRYSREADSILFNGEQKFLHYDLTKLPVNASFNLNVQTKQRLKIQAVAPTQFGMHSYLSNVGLQNGQIRHRLTNLRDSNRVISFTHMIPWFLRVYMHTIAMECECAESGNPLINPDRHYSLAVDRVKPALIELTMPLPANSVCVLSIDYETAFMRAQEFHPDANYGNYIPGAVVYTRRDHNELLDNSTLLRETDDDSVLVYGETLLVQMPTPDFSMPFNVLCLVSTVIAIFYGPIHGLTTKMVRPCVGEVPVKKPLIRKLVELIFGILKGIVDKLRRKKKQE